MAKGDAKASKKKRDNLEAARLVRDALGGFDQEEQERILRWAAESLGISALPPAPLTPTPTLQRPTGPPVPPAPTKPTGVDTAKNVKSFVDEKNPRTDIHLATSIAYFYRFEAPAAERKDDIDATFLREALRLAGRPGKLVKPLKTLNNAHAKGLLDRNGPGRFSINSVGENLVGMTLPMKSSDGKKTPKTK